MKNVVITKLENFQPHTKSDGTRFNGGTVYQVETGEFKLGSLDSILTSYTVYTEADALKVKEILENKKKEQSSGNLEK